MIMDTRSFYGRYPFGVDKTLLYVWNAGRAKPKWWCIDLRWCIPKNLIESTCGEFTQIDVSYILLGMQFLSVGCFCLRYDKTRYTTTRCRGIKLLNGSHRRDSMCWSMTIAVLTTRRAHVWLNLWLMGCHSIPTSRCSSTTGSLWLYPTIGRGPFLVKRCIVAYNHLS